jgi:hypothetical protein
VIRNGVVGEAWYKGRGKEAFGVRHRRALLKVHVILRSLPKAKIPVILRSLPEADDEESDRQRQILRYAQDDGLIGFASLRMTG